MNPDQGFVDLRLNRQEGQTEESFWPSFTDIMTVIVMIFLLAMVVLLIRNMELVDQLRATMEAEREAAALAQATGKEKENLTDKLTAARNRLALLQQQITRLEALREQQEVAIASQRSRIAALGGERDRLTQNLQDETARGRMLDEQLQSTRSQLLEWQDRHTRLETREAETRSRLDVLKQSQETTLDELAGARQELARLLQVNDALETQGNEQQAALAALLEEQKTRDRELADARGELEKTAETLRRRNATLDASRAEGETLRRNLEAASTALQDSRTALGESEVERQRLARLHQDTLTQLTESRREARLRGDAMVRNQATLEQLQRERQLEQAEKSRLAEQLTQLVQHNRELGDSKAALEQLQRTHAELEQRYSGSRKEVEDLRTRLAVQEQALAQSLARLEQANLSLSDLQEDFGDLKLKYDDLVKPARSAEGRYVVEVRVNKEDGKLVIRFRESRDQDFQRMDRAALDARLEALKAEHRRGLYVRVIIPDNSGLSYNEAWSFTSELHGRYDYYFQND